MPATLAADEAASYSKNRVFFAACLGMLLFGVVFLSLGAVNNMLSARLSLSNSEIGTLAALLPFGILVGSLVFGPIVDRFGYRWMLIGAALIVGASLEGLAFGQNHRLIQLVMFLIGLGGGILNGATNALAADVSEGQRGARLSLLGVSFGVGAIAMPGTIALLSERLEPSTIVAVLGALVMLPVLYCLVIAFPPPKQRTADVAGAGWFSLLRDPIFLVAGLALAIQSGMEGMSNDWMTRYFKNVTFAEQASDEWKTQLGLVAVASSMTLTRLLLAGILKHLSVGPVLVSSIATAAVGAATLMYSTTYGVALLAAVLIGAGLAGTFPLVLGIIGDRYPQQSGTAFSTIFVLALVGNMAINKTFGYIAEIHGIDEYARVMLLLLAASLLLVSLVLWLRRTRSAV